jgi:hypothetical protein
MILIKKIFCSFLCIFLLQGTACSQNLLDYSNSLKYADYLFKTNQYNLASIEFERVVFLEPKDTLSKLKLIQSYRYLTEYKTALNKIEEFFPYNLNNLPEEFSDEYVRNLLYENQFQKTNEFLQTVEYMDVGVRSEYELGIYILQYQWSEARRFADEHLGVLEESVRYNSLNDIIINGLNANYKSPFLAASISAVIPGGGKVYTGRWKDAIYSFLFVTTSSWLTYKSYQKNGFSFNSVLIGSFALTFYSANIYGSAKSAKGYNQKINQSFRSETVDILLKDQKK